MRSTSVKGSSKREPTKARQQQAAWLRNSAFSPLQRGRTPAAAGHCKTRRYFGRALPSYMKVIGFGPRM